MTSRTIVDTAETVTVNNQPITLVRQWKSVDTGRQPDRYGVDANGQGYHMSKTRQWTKTDAAFAPAWTRTAHQELSA